MLLLAGTLLFCLAAHAAPKDETVVFKNGDHLAGELKELSRGKLSFKTDATDKISIEWDDVAEVTSPRHMEVEHASGRRYFGTLGAGSGAGRVRVDGFDSFIDLPTEEIVRITPIEDRFWTRLDGSVNLGYDYTQASRVSTFNFSASVNYRARQYLYGLDLSSNLTNQETGSTSRQDLTIRFQRFLANRWFTEWNPQLQSNEDLGIDLRLLLPVTIGRDLVQTNHVLFALSGGLAYNRESLAGAAESNQSLEGIGRLRYEVFQQDFPRIDLVVTLSVYPGITNSGRVRGEFSTNLRYELLRDFFFQINIQDSYDSRPETEGAQSSDVVVSTSLGWTF